VSTGTGQQAAHSLTGWMRAIKCSNLLLPLLPPSPPLLPLLLPPLQFIAPGEIVEGLTTEDPQDNPFARLFAGRQRPGSASDLLNQPLEVDLNDRRSYDRQIYDQVRDGVGVGVGAAGV
jgi:hypothetical protein